MALVKFLSANLAAGATVAVLTPSSTVIEITPGAGALFPPIVADQYFMATLSNSAGSINEIVKVIDRTGDVMTVERAQEDTAALTWALGSLFEQKWTAGQAQALVQIELLRPTLSVKFEDGLTDVEIDLSDYDFTSAGVLIKMSATEAKTLVDITGFSVGMPVTLYVEEGSSTISIDLDVAPFYLSNIYGPYGWPGYALTTLSLLSVPGNAAYKFIETSRTARA